MFGMAFAFGESRKGNPLPDVHRAQPEDSNVCCRHCAIDCSGNTFLREAVPALFFLFRRASNYDLIHVFGNSPVTAAAVIYAKIKRKPLIVELVNLKDNPHLYEPALIRYLFGPGFPSWALIVCLSEYLYRICRKFGYSRNQLWCRPNPIDEKRFNLSPPRTSVPEIRQHFQKTDILILHLAKFIPRKHQKFMIDVLALLPERYKLVLAGPLVNAGPLRERDQAYYQSIRSAIMNTGLQDRVAIVPEFIEHPEEYMKACDVFVLPSEDEAFGTPFLEAIACGKPAVVNDIPGVFDLWVRPGINGFICQLDPELWAKCIQKAFAIPQETRNRASRRILRKASTETIDQIYIDRIHLLTNSPLGKRTAF